MEKSKANSIEKSRPKLKVESRIKSRVKCIDRQNQP